MLTVPTVHFWVHRRPLFRTLASPRLHSLLAVVCLGSALPSPILGQEPPAGLVEVSDGGRHGFWFAAGVGAGGESNDVIAGSGYSRLFYQPTISLRIGGTVSPHLRLGGELLSWINDEGHAVESVSSALLVAQLYPLERAGLYLKAGVGIGRNAVDFDDGFNIGDTGFAGLVGAGYELRLGHRIFLNPAVDLVGQTYEGRAGGRYRERLVNFGLGLLVQTGR
jgi:hypothetical protein